MRRILALALALCAGCARERAPVTTATAEPSSGSQTAQIVTIRETGSALLFPLMRAWAAAYMRDNSRVRISTEITNSGAGISQTLAGIAQIGASDLYLSTDQQKAFPLLNIPVALNAELVYYNVPEIAGAQLRLNGPVLAEIYAGKITRWNDAAIRTINPSLAARLPDAAIVPIRRADACIDTFVFTQFLGFSTPWWMLGPSYGPSITWPKRSGMTVVSGAQATIAALQRTRYALAYAGITDVDRIERAGVPYALLKNRSEQYVEPTAKTIAAAASALTAWTLRDGRAPLDLAPGEQSYPMVNYEFAMVEDEQSDPRVATELSRFLRWAVRPDQGNNEPFTRKARLYPIPAPMIASDLRQISRIRFAPDAF